MFIFIFFLQVFYDIRIIRSLFVSVKFLNYPFTNYAYCVKEPQKNAKLFSLYVNVLFSFATDKKLVKI